MEYFEFKYHRKGLAIKCIVAGVLLGMLITLIGSLLEPHFEALSKALWLIGFIVLTGLTSYGFNGANAHGIGILHDKHVEIKLKGKEYLIEYAKIKKIDESVFSRKWCINIHGEPSLTIYPGAGWRSKTNLYPIELFMTALYKRLELKQYIR